MGSYFLTTVNLIMNAYKIYFIKSFSLPLAILSYKVKKETLVLVHRSSINLHT